jgi:hypothetical protein
MKTSINPQLTAFFDFILNFMTALLEPISGGEFPTQIRNTMIYLGDAHQRVPEETTVVNPNRASLWLNLTLVGYGIDLLNNKVVGPSSPYYFLVPFGVREILTEYRFRGTISASGTFGFGACHDHSAYYGTLVTPASSRTFATGANLYSKQRDTTGRFGQLRDQLQHRLGISGFAEARQNSLSG